MIFSSEEVELFRLKQVFSGSDEAGRGCLAGPVYGASVILPENFDGSLINDSKKLSSKDREEAYKVILENCLSFSYKYIDNNEIDKINILQAAIKSMHQSIEKLTIEPELCFIDGNKFHSTKYTFKTIIGGDSKFLSIAAASIIAKVERDRWMLDIAHKLYPEYDFNIHKGYATKLHFEKIDKYGVTPIHRKSFLKKYYERRNQLNIF